MLNYIEIVEIECVFVLIDNNVIPYETTERYLKWLSSNNLELFCLLNWMLTRWVHIRKHKYHLPKKNIEQRNIYLNCMV